MTQLILAAWSVSVVILFLPVGPVARLMGRRLRRVFGGPGAQAANEAAETPPGSAEPSAPSAGIVAEGAAGTPTHLAHSQLEELEAPVAVAEPPGDSESERGAPSPLPAADEEEPAIRSEAPPVPLRKRALGLFVWLATASLYVVFLSSSVYLMPRLLVGILDTKQPVAAITSQSMYPELKRGDLLLLEGVAELSDLRVGDILAFESEDGFAIHRIVIIDGEEIITKGDANLITDKPIGFDQVIGRALTIRGRLAKVPYIGNIPLVFKKTAEEADETDAEAESLPLGDAELEGERVTPVPYTPRPR